MRTAGRETSKNVIDVRREGRLAQRNVGMIGRAVWSDPTRQMRNYLLSPDSVGGGEWFSSYGIDSAITAAPNYKLERRRIAQEQMAYLIGYETSVSGSSTATVNLVADIADTPAFTRHVQQQADAGAISSNIEDRRGASAPVARSFEFDGTTVWLDVSKPDGTTMSDEEAVEAYKESGSNLGTSWQPYWQTASKSPTYNFTQPANANLTDAEIRTLTYTVLGEAGGEGVAGMTAVANVINNRSLYGGVYPSNPADVALQGGTYHQFSTWNDPANGGNQAHIQAIYPTDSANYRLAEAIVRRTFIDGTMPDNTGGSLNYHVTGITNGWIQNLQANSPYGSIQIGNQTFYPQHPIPPMNIPDVGSLMDTAGGAAGGVSLPPLPKPRPEPGVANPAIANALAAMGGVDSSVTVSPYVNWAGQIVSRETIPLTSTEIDDQLYGMIAPQSDKLDPIGEGPGTWSDFRKGLPLPAPAPLKPGDISAPPAPTVPLPRPRPDVTSEGLAIRKVTTVEIGPDGNPVANTPKPVPVAGKPVTLNDITGLSHSIPSTVTVRQTGTVPVNQEVKRPNGEIRPKEVAGNVALPAGTEPDVLKKLRPLTEPIAAPTVSPATKAIMNDVSRVTVTPATAKLVNVGAEPPAITMGTVTTKVTEVVQNPAYTKWLETYGHGGANASGSPDDRDEKNALGNVAMGVAGAAGPNIVPPPPPATITVTRDRTTTVRTVAEPKAPAVPTYVNSRGQQVVKVMTTRYDPDLNDWVPAEKYVPVEKATPGALPAGSAVVSKPKGDSGGDSNNGSGSSGGGAQYVRQSDGGALKQVTGTVYNYDTQQFETRTHYVSA